MVRNRQTVRLAPWFMVACASAALTWALGLALPAAVRAQETPRLSGQVTDLTRDQVLAGGRAQIDAALARLLQQHNVQLWALFVDSTGGRSVTAYADTVARQNSLGGNDALLVVAVADRSDALWRGSQSLDRLTDRELEDVLTRRVEPLLARGDFAGAVVAAAGGVGEVAGEGSAGSGGSDGGGGGMAGAALPLALLAGGGGLLAWRMVGARRRQRQAGARQQQQLEQREHEANALLIAADESLRDAREEIGFVEAQFGAAEVAPYRAAVERAAAELLAAFELRQELDDAIPEDDERRSQIIEEVSRRAGQAQALLDEQQERIEQLRIQERTAPETLAALPGQIDGAEARLPAAERAFAALERYAERSRASVTGNIEAARELLAHARTAVTEGQQALAADDRAAARQQVRAAQQALADASRLLDAIDNLAASLRQMETTAPAQRAAAEADLRAARAAVAGSGRNDLAGRLAEAEQALREAEQLMAEARPDYPGATRLIAQADSAADAILAELRQEEERREREARMVAGQLRAAEADYDRVAGFISSRRRLIGSTARTRLATAARHLDRARTRAPDDPAAALAEARRAQDLTEDAYALAVEDVEAHQPYGGGWGGPSRGGMVLPVPIPFPMGGIGGGIRVGGGFGGSGGGGGRSVGGRW